MRPRFRQDCAARARDKEVQAQLLNSRLAGGYTPSLRFAPAPLTGVDCGPVNRKVFCRRRGLGFHPAWP